MQIWTLSQWHSLCGRIGCRLQAQVTEMESNAKKLRSGVEIGIIDSRGLGAQDTNRKQEDGKRHEVRHHSAAEPGAGPEERENVQRPGEAQQNGRKDTIPQRNLEPVPKSVRMCNVQRLV